MSWLPKQTVVVPVDFAEESVRMDTTEPAQTHSGEWTPTKTLAEWRPNPSLRPYDTGEQLNG
ncbi:MAG TPA: hypothetical protein QF564_04210 [Pirellulaceae bacterium]|nr:hypothetical protein [Pirellulaceae bacterium]